jgi:hypothetical protein
VVLKGWSLYQNERTEVIKYRLYRGLCVIFGARSFVKKGVDEKTYALVKGDTKHMATILRDQGFIEEWPSGDR